MERKKYVYTVLDEGTHMVEILEQRGYVVLQGNGAIEEEKLKICSALIPGKCRISHEILDQAPDLKIVAKFGVGVDQIDITACTQRGIYVANTPLANYISVAEHTMALLLASAKKLMLLPQIVHSADAGWKESRELMGTELYGKTLAIIGLGRIGRRVAGMAHAFGMRLVGCDPYVNASDLPDYILLTELKTALSCADFVTIHVAGNQSVRNMIAEPELNSMKRTAVLINTTRGFVINETDLVQALELGSIAGAALDVVSEEPIRKDNPLLTMPQVIVTPHIAANTPEARRRAQEACAEAISEALEGKRPSLALN